MTSGVRDVTGAKPAARPWRTPLRVLLALCVVALLSQAPSSAPAQTATGRANDCQSASPDSPQACSRRPLDDHTALPTPRRAPPLLTVSRLPQGRVGEPYPSTRVLWGGMGNYIPDPRSVLLDLHLTHSGFLEGTPHKAGQSELLLIARDTASPPNEVQGVFSLTVRPARDSADHPVVHPIVTPPTPPAAPTPAPTGQIAIWSLSQGDLAILAKGPPPIPEVPPEASAAPPPEARPFVPGERSPPAPDRRRTEPLFALKPAQQQRLNAIVNLEYPTLALINSALHARLDPLKGEDALRAADFDVIVKQAFKPQYLSQAQPMQAKDDISCGCVPPPPLSEARTTYGFLPFWRPTRAGQTVDFSLFSRVEVLGVQIKSPDTWLRPGAGPQDNAKWAREMSQLAVAAQAHGAHLDLVLQGSDWAFLGGADDKALKKMADIAASSALHLMDDTKLTGVEPTLRHALIDALWGTRPHRVFDGVTVMFQPPSGQLAPAFDIFFDRFVLDLTDETNKNHTKFLLNIVMPYDASKSARETMFREGSFTAENILRYEHRQTANQSPSLTLEEQKSYVKDSNLLIRFLVLLPSQTSLNKKALRAEIDKLEDQNLPYPIQGHARVTLTNDIIPVILTPAGATPVAAASTFGAPAIPPGDNKEFAGHPEDNNSDHAQASDDLEADLFYHRQNFGGVGVWPIPVSKLDAGTFVQGEIFKALYQDGSKPPERSWIDRLLPVCSTWLRLLFEALILIVVSGFLACLYANVSPKQRQTIAVTTVVLLAVAVSLGGFLLENDTAWFLVKQGNKPFYATLILLIGLGLIQLFRPKIKTP